MSTTDKEGTRNVPRLCPLFLARGNQNAEVLAAWQWCRFLKQQSSSKTPVLLNLDETSVRFCYSPQKGLRVKPVGEERQRDQFFVGRNSSRSQLRKAFTHIGIICECKEFQALCPHILMIADKMVTQAEVLEVKASLPSNILLWVQKTGWVSTSTFVQVVQELQSRLAHLQPTHQFILLLDAHCVHVCDAVLSALGRADIWVAVLPSLCTHVLQPLDTDVFAIYKQCLRRTLHELMATGPNVNLKFPAIAAAVVSTVQQIVIDVNWSSAFHKNGFGQPDQVRASLWSVVSDVSREARTSSCLPSLAQFEICFPRGREIPLGLLLDPVVMPSSTFQRRPLNVSRVRPATELDAVEPGSAWKSRLRPRDASGNVLRSGSSFLPCDAATAALPPLPCPSVPTLSATRLPVLPAAARMPPRVSERVRELRRQEEELLRLGRRSL